VFAWSNPWQEIFRVDILNCMALGVAALSLVGLLPSAKRVAWCATAGLAIAGLAPVVRTLDWSGVPWIVRNYIVPNNAYFSFFPDAAYIALGACFGAVLRRSPGAVRDRLMEWAACLGLALVVTAHYFSNLPFSIYAKSDFWLDSPGLSLIRVGIVL